MLTLRKIMLVMLVGCLSSFVYAGNQSISTSDTLQQTLEGAFLALDWNAWRKAWRTENQVDAYNVAAKAVVQAVLEVLGCDPGEEYVLDKLQEVTILETVKLVHPIITVLAGDFVAAVDDEEF